MEIAAMDDNDVVLNSVGMFIWYLENIGHMMPAVNSQRQVTSGDTFTMKGCQLDQQQLTLHRCATTRLSGL